MTEQRKRRKVKTDGRWYPEYPCLCGQPDCLMALAVALDVTTNAVVLDIRESGITRMQTYLDAEQAVMLASELRSMAAKLAPEKYR